MSRAGAQVRRARPTDRDVAAATLASAFAVDPVMSWLVGAGRDVPACLSHMFSHSLGVELRREPHLVDVVDAGHAVAVWHEVDQWRGSTIDAMRSIPMAVRTFGRRLPMAIRTRELLERLHPDEPHRHLEYIGVDDGHQGRGLGGALLASMTAECDERGVAAYLESSNPRNEPLYARYGFEPRSPVSLPGGGPDITPMWRPAR